MPWAFYSWVNKTKIKLSLFWLEDWMPWKKHLISRIFQNIYKTAQRQNKEILLVWKMVAFGENHLSHFIQATYFSGVKTETLLK